MQVICGVGRSTRRTVRTLDLLRVNMRTSLRGTCDSQSAQADVIVQMDVNGMCEEVKNQVSLNKRLLSKASSEVQIEQDKLETARRFAENVQYGIKKLMERTKAHHDRVRSHRGGLMHLDHDPQALAAVARGHVCGLHVSAGHI